MNHSAGVDFWCWMERFVEESDRFCKHQSRFRCGNPGNASFSRLRLECLLHWQNQSTRKRFTHLSRKFTALYIADTVRCCFINSCHSSDFRVAVFVGHQTIALSTSL